MMMNQEKKTMSMYHAHIYLNESKKNLLGSENKLEPRKHHHQPVILWERKFQTKLKFTTHTNNLFTFENQVKLNP